jgi:hypothetical protein
MKEPAAPPAAWKRVAAHSQFKRGCNAKLDAPCDKEGGGMVAVMGYTQRMDEWRYTVWVRFNYADSTPDWETVYGRELYDHRASPVPKDWAIEHINVVDDPEHSALVQRLHNRLVRCGARPDLC